MTHIAALDFLEVTALPEPSSVSRCLEQMHPGLRTVRIPASARLHGPLGALARIVWGGLRYVAGLLRRREHGQTCAIVTHISLGFILAWARRLGWPIRYALLGVIAGAPRPGMGGAMRERFYRWVITRADLVMCHSRRECELYVQRFGQPPGKFHVVPSRGGISPLWRFGRRRGFPRRYIASAGRTNRDYATLGVAARAWPCPTVLATDAPVPNDLPANVVVRGDLFGGEYLQLLAGSACVVVPLLRDDESSGQMVMLEAMLLGKPVVVTETSTTIEYGTDGETCLLVPAGDAAALEAAVKRLLSDPSLAQRLGAAGCAYARRCHSAGAFARAVLHGLQAGRLTPPTVGLVQPHRR